MPPHSLPELADNERLYVFGDIHGRFDLLENVYRQIMDELATGPKIHTKEIFLGDYIDRGPDTATVIDFLANRPAACDERICLCGNHEASMLDVLRDAGLLENWQKHGGRATLLSYGVEPGLDDAPSRPQDIQKALRQALPLSHYTFLSQLQESFVYKGYYFVHAGIRPGVAWAAQSRRDKLWIRHDFINAAPDWPGVIVHGHTPVTHPDINEKRMNIDTGAWTSGRLTCLVLEGTAFRGTACRVLSS